MAIGRAAVGMDAALRRGDDVTAGLDRTRANERMPMRLAGGHREGGGNGDHLRPAIDERAIEFGEAQIITDAEAQTADWRVDERDRFAAAQALQARLGCTLVLKGAGSIIASAGQPPSVICAGNPGMAVGGMGDVLTGIIAALLAQGMAAGDAALAGALLHAVAGDAAAREDGERGLLPSDLAPWLRRLANPMRR